MVDHPDKYTMSFLSTLGIFVRRGQQSPATFRPLPITKWNVWQFDKRGARSFSSTLDVEREQRPIFVAATKQHVGKVSDGTAICPRNAEEKCLSVFLFSNQFHVSFSNINFRNSCLDSSFKQFRRCFKFNLVD